MSAYLAKTIVIGSSDLRGFGAGRRERGESLTV